MVEKSQKASNKATSKTETKKPVYQQPWFWIVIAAVVLIIGVGAGSGNENGEEATSETTTSSESGGIFDSTSDQKKEYKVGETITLDDRKITVNSVERKWSSGNTYMTPESGQEWVKVTVTYENTSDKNITRSTSDWQVQESSGTIEDTEWVGGEGILEYGEIASGGKTTAAIVFEVPTGDDFSIRYRTNWLSDGTDDYIITLK